MPMPIDPRLVTIYEQTSRGERPYDIYSKLLADRIIFLKDGKIVDESRLSNNGEDSTGMVRSKMEAMAV